MSDYNMESPPDVLHVIHPLDQDGRTKAHKAAQDALATWIGVAPTREQFANSAVSKYPLWMTWGIVVLCIFLLAAGFTPSAIRLYDVGSKTFGHAIADAASMNWVGIATILLAETGQVVFLLALNILGEHASNRAKGLLLLSAFASTLVALVGNLQTVEPWIDGKLFSWIEAIVPPLLVLSTSYVLKEQMLDAIAQRHANEEAYRVAMHAYEAQVSNLEKHDHWQRFYANALIEQLRKVNKSKSAKEAFKQITEVQKLMLFQRELKADAWYVQAVEMQNHLQEQEAQRQQYEQERLARLQAKALQSGGGGGAHTGEVDNARIEQSGEMHVAHCPHCSYVTPAKQTELQAKRALAAHLRSHKQTVVAFPDTTEEDTEPVEANVA